MNNIRKINYENGLTQKRKQELLKQLVQKTEKNIRLIKKLLSAWVIWFASLLADWLYNIVLFVTEKNLREGRNWAKKMIKFLDAVFRERFHFWLILFALVWIAALFIAVQGLIKWLIFHSQVKKIEVELSNLEK